jgi:N6-L-threonylcarbamoyladenine synthase
VAVTRGPGLVGALLVALSAGKAIAYARKLPLIGVHHIEGHLHAIQLEQEVDYPFLALAVSGGHTHLYRVNGVGDYHVLGMTVDDAAGEAFDKVAKLMGLGYPGGVEIDRHASDGDPKAYDFPRPMLHKKNLQFSFSGLKTAVSQVVQPLAAPINGRLLKDLSASFQQAVVDVLVRKTFAAASEHGNQRIVVCGGVACNSALRREFAARGEAEGVDVFFPSPLLCSDNAAMLGVPADAYLQAGCRHPLDLNAVPSWPLDLAGKEILTLAGEA